MANIGTVYKDSYIKDGKDIPLIKLDIRTITQRKKFTISVNKHKYVDGVLKKENIIQGKEEHPDYHIWANFSNRGESIPSVIVGSVKNAVSQHGLAYKSAKIFDPFISRYSIYFTMFEASVEDKEKNKDLLYNVVASPYQPNATSNNSEPQAYPSYDTQQSNQQSYTTSNGNSVPVEEQNIPTDPDEEIPF